MNAEYAIGGEFKVDDNARAFARHMFRLKVHQADGQTYEDLFVAVMRLSDPDFQAVRPYGNVGDRKNDGFNRVTGAYYQVYAPQEYIGSEKTALKKLRDDFKGLKVFWEKLYAVKSFHFVLNDKYRTVGPPLHKLIGSIKKKYNLDDATILLSQHLEHKTFALPDDQLITIVGHIPKINPGDFLFLSGFTYFMGAWIDFERTARRMVSRLGDRPMAGRQLLDLLKRNGLLKRDAELLVYQLNAIRNPLVHGDSSDLPEKAEIDKLVEITEGLKGKLP